MKRVITKRLREQAAIVCSLKADNARFNWAFPSWAGTSAGASLAAQELAYDAYAYVGRKNIPWEGGRDFSEAESLLRTGFVPEGWRDA